MAAQLISPENKPKLPRSLSHPILHTIIEKTIKTSLRVQVLSEKPSDASAVFEHLSASVKESTVKLDNTAPSKGQQAAAAAQLGWAQSSQALFAVPDEPPEGGAAVPDMLDEANMWEWGGVSFGRLETYRLYLSVKKVGWGYRLSRGRVCSVSLR